MSCTQDAEEQAAQVGLPLQGTTSAACPHCGGTETIHRCPVFLQSWEGRHAAALVGLRAAIERFDGYHDDEIVAEVERLAFRLGPEEANAVADWTYEALDTRWDTSAGSMYRRYRFLTSMAWLRAQALPAWYRAYQEAQVAVERVRAAIQQTPLPSTVAPDLDQLLSLPRTWMRKESLDMVDEAAISLAGRTRKQWEQATSLAHARLLHREVISAGHKLAEGKDSHQALTVIQTHLTQLADEAGSHALLETVTHLATVLETASPRPDLTNARLKIERQVARLTEPPRRETLAVDAERVREFLDRFAPPFYAQTLDQGNQVVLVELDTEGHSATVTYLPPMTKLIRHVRGRFRTLQQKTDFTRLNFSEARQQRAENESIAFDSLRELGTEYELSQPYTSSDELGLPESYDSHEVDFTVERVAATLEGEWGAGFKEVSVQNGQLVVGSVGYDDGDVTLRRYPLAPSLQAMTAAFRERQLQNQAFYNSTASPADKWQRCEDNLRAAVEAGLAGGLEVSTSLYG